ncbi:MAG TPA: efflux RND transporter permease subunit [Candidatus Desulfaltia sp.]|nr:efflux RND transporter permease subunit [Candidatus Desulfaltia sp.]
MKLAKVAIERPVATLMFYIAIILLGFISLRQLSVDLLPDISYPRLSVVTEYPGVAPEEIETLITEPLEAAVSRIPGLRRVESVSKEGVSYLTLEFGWGTDMDFATLHAREKLDSVRFQLPEEAENPTIIALDPKTKPIMVVAVSGEATLLELKEFCEELIKPRLEQIEGIGSAEVAGGVEREIQVEINPQLMALYGLSIDEISRRIDGFNRNLQGGNIRKGKFKYALRVVGEFEMVDEIGEITLKSTPERGVIRLRDIARVEDSIKERQGSTRLNGDESIGILVRKESGANTVEVTRKAKVLLEEIGKEYPRVGLSVVSEQARFIREAVASVKEEIVFGGLLAFLVLLIFLQEFRTSLIIFAVISISVIATFNLLFFRNITLNIMSLGGLALGVGMLDDCAIVVSENIFRHRSLGKSLSEAAYIGTKEVGMAVSATIFTTIVVFLPVIYVHGVAGQLFRDQALTVTFSLLASLVVSLTLVPMLASRTFTFKPVAIEAPPAKETGKKGIRRDHRPSRWRYLLYPIIGLRQLLYFIPRMIVKELSWLASLLAQLLQFILHYLTIPFRPVLRAVFKRFNIIYAGFTVRYHRFLIWSLDHKSRILWISTAFFLLTFVLGAILPRELMPKLRVSSFEVNLKAPVDYSFEQTSELVSSLERWLKGKDTISRFFSEVGIISGMEGLNPEVSINSAKVRVDVKHHRDLEPTIDSLRGWLRNYPDLTFLISKEQTTLAQFLAFSSSALSLKIKGDDLDALKGLATELAEKIQAVDGIADVTTSLGEGKPEFLIKIRKDRLEKYGLAPDAISTYLVQAVKGKVASQLRELDKKYDILVRIEAGTRENIEALLDQQLVHQGRTIPLRELVEHEIALGPKEIHRENQQREVIITANLRGARMSQVIPPIREKIAELNLPPNYRVVFGGEQEEMSSSFRSLIWAFVLSIFLVYMIMAAQFESLLHPFLIMFTIPMGLAGVFLALFLTGQTINVISIIGIVVLVGIVIDNAIVKIDFTNQLRRSGMPLREAIIEGSMVRQRPILMSSITTVFGLIPLALGLGEGAELQRPLGIAVIGGLLFSTFLTLILIPVVYELVEKGREKKRP